MTTDCHVITRQGAVKVNSSCIIKVEPTLVCIEVDLGTKYTELLSGTVEDGGPCVQLYTGLDSLHFHPGGTGPTELTFPAYTGWEIFTCEVNRYTVRLVLVKRA